MRVEAYLIPSQTLLIEVAPFVDVFGTLNLSMDNNLIVVSRIASIENRVFKQLLERLVVRDRPDLEGWYCTNITQVDEGLMLSLAEENPTTTNPEMVS